MTRRALVIGIGLCLAPESFAGPAKHVRIVDSGPMEMKDKRDYTTVLVLGPRIVPLGIGGRVMESLDDHLSVMAGAGYSGWEILGLHLRHLDARAGLDYEPLGNGLHGMYVGPRVVYRSFLGSVDADGGPQGLATQTLGVGGVAGWRFVWDPGISVGGGIGAAYTTWLADAGALDGEGVKAIGLAPMAEFTVGFAF